MLSESYLGLTFPSQQGNAYLLFTFDVTEAESIRKNAYKVEHICKQHEALEFLLLEDEESYNTTWKIRGSIVTAIEASTQQEPIDIVVPINKSAEFVKYTKEVSRQFGLDIQNFGHAGDVNVHLCIIRGELNEEEWGVRLDKTLQAIYKKANDVNGLPSGEHGIGLTKKKYFLQYADTKEITLMKALKSSFDPHQILNPNKAY